MTLTLAQIMPWAQVALWSGFVVFLRVGAMLSLVPAFGEQSVPVRIRLKPGQDPEHLLRPGMSVDPKVWLNR